MTNPRRALCTVLVLISLPALLALVEAARFRAAHRNTGTFISSGERREYLVHVPSKYDAATPAALVISLHGAALRPSTQRAISRWNEAADREGFIVVYPSAVAGRGPRVWRASAHRDLALEVRFIAELIDTLSATYSIDPRRIYANGLSNGGGMSFALSCTLADRIAAVGMVGAAHLLPWRACPDLRPVPMIAFHGTEDRTTPYDGGVSWVTSRILPSIPRWTEAWAQRNHCAATPVDSIIAPDVTRIEYPACADDASVVLYRIEGGGHTWPGGGAMPEWFVGRTSTSVDATAVMWNFFEDHPLVPRG